MTEEIYKQAESIQYEIARINDYLKDLEDARSVGYERKTSHISPPYQYTKFYKDNEVKEVVISYYKAKIIELKKQFEELQ